MSFLKAAIDKNKQGLSYSWAGLKAAWAQQLSFRLELLAFIIALPIALVLGKSAMQKAVLIAPLFLVLVVELVNSAIEAVVDRIGLEQHVLSGRAKDLGSAAVFLAMLNVLVVWFLMLFFG